MLVCPSLRGTVCNPPSAGRYGATAGQWQQAPTFRHSLFHAPCPKADVKQGMTKHEIVRMAGAMIAIAMLANGCSQGQAPFRTVQLCLASPQEIPAFVNVMNAIAQRHQMKFTDRSGQTEAELRSINIENVQIAHPHVNIGADQNGDFNFGAGNLALPTRQMAIGFNGHDAAAARQFANAAVAELSKQWRIIEVPQGRGALPLADCV